MPVAVRLLRLPLIFCLLLSQASGGEPPQVTLGGEVGQAADTITARLRFAPFDSLAWLRADMTNEKVSEHDDNFHNVMRRPYKHFSGDISGRFIEVMALKSHGKDDVHPEFKALLDEVIKHQRDGGYFCASGEIDWQQPLDYIVGDESLETGRMLPALWGNARMLCGLIECAKAFPENDAIKQAAVRLGDFYVSVMPRFNDPARIDEYTGSGTYASGHVICWFPAMEGLVKLKRLTGDGKYLDAAIAMAAFYERFDQLPVDHAHGMLCNHVSLLMLYEETGKDDYLKRVETRWQALVDDGYVNPAGGILEKCHVQYERDEGCGIADWLRLNLALGKVTGKARYWDMAERTLHNHLLQNQHPKGGFGHRYMATDKGGAYAFQKRNYESTWCCSFHGELAFSEIRRHVLDRAEGILTCRFPLEFTAVDDVGTTTSIFQLPWKDSHVIRQRLSLAGQPATRLRVRQPDWAEKITARDGWGKLLELEREGNWLTTKQAVTEALFVYEGALYAENRHCKRLPDGPIEGQPFVIRYGPKLLAASGESAVKPAWPSSLQQLKQQGIEPLSSSCRNKSACFVMGCGQ